MINYYTTFSKSGWNTVSTIRLPKNETSSPINENLNVHMSYILECQKESIISLTELNHPNIHNGNHILYSTTFIINSSSHLYKLSLKFSPLFSQYLHRYSLP